MRAHLDPKLLLTMESQNLMLRAAARARPREACGVIVGSRAFELTNNSKENGFFEMDSDQLIAVYEEHGDIDGVWHSHPQGSAMPSGTDLVFHPQGKRLVIVAAGRIVDHGVPERAIAGVPPHSSAG